MLLINLCKSIVAKRRIRCIRFCHGSRNREGGDEARLRWGELKLGHAADRECRAVGRARSSSAAPRPEGVAARLWSDERSALLLPSTLLCVDRGNDRAASGKRRQMVRRVLSWHDGLQSRLASASRSLFYTGVWTNSASWWSLNFGGRGDLARLSSPSTLSRGLSATLAVPRNVFETYGTLILRT